jgi:hypothetical protein
LKEAASIWRELAAQKPAAYRPDLAGTLPHLGRLYEHTGILPDAEAVYKEAVTIQRELAAHHPAYRGGSGEFARRPGRNVFDGEPLCRR